MVKDWGSLHSSLDFFEREGIKEKFLFMSLRTFIFHLFVHPAQARLLISLKQVDQNGKEMKQQQKYKQKQTKKKITKKKEY